MTDAQKTAMVKTLVENDSSATDEVVAVFLNLACNTMIKWLYPFDSTKEPADLPVCYETDQCELAARYFLRRGGQGEINHEENGVNRQYGSVDDEDILKRLTPFAKVGG